MKSIEYILNYNKISYTTPKGDSHLYLYLNIDDADNYSFLRFDLYYVLDRINGNFDEISERSMYYWLRDYIQDQYE